MSSDWYNPNENHSSNYVVAQTQLYQKGSDGFPSNRLKLPPLNTHASHIPNRPQTGTNDQLIINGAKTDYYLSSVGFANEMLLELTVKNNHNSTAANILPQYLIEKIEIMAGLSEQVVSTIKADQIYLQRIFDSYEKGLRVQRAEGLSVSTYNNDSTLAAGASRTYLLEIKNFLTTNDMNLNVSAEKIIFRITWSQKGTDLPGYILYQDSAVHSKGIALEPSHQSKDLVLRKQTINKYGYLEVAQHDENLSLTTNATYDIKLSAMNGYCAFMVILVRPSNPSFSQLNSYQILDSISLLDKNANIIGQRESSLMLTTRTNKNFKGHILEIKNNIYIIPFCENPQLAMDGSVNGYTKFDSQQFLRINTEGTITPGSYTVSIISYFYATVEVRNGFISSYKN
jgi:hypothetical protein